MWVWVSGVRWSAEGGCTLRGRDGMPLTRGSHTRLGTTAPNHTLQRQTLSTNSEAKCCFLSVFTERICEPASPELCWIHHTNAFLVPVFCSDRQCGNFKNRQKLPFSPALCKKFFGSELVESHGTRRFELATGRCLLPTGPGFANQTWSEWLGSGFTLRLIYSVPRHGSLPVRFCVGSAPWTNTGFYLVKVREK